MGGGHLAPRCRMIFSSVWAAMLRAGLWRRTEPFAVEREALPESALSSGVANLTTLAPISSFAQRAMICLGRSVALESPLFGSADLGFPGKESE